MLLLLYSSSAFQTAKELKTKIQSHMKTCFRYGLAMKRLCDAYNDRVFGTTKIKRKSAVMMLMDTGEQCTISGSGHIFNGFKTTGVIEGFNGQGMNLTEFSDPNSDAALLWIMQFDDTYHGMTYDVTHSNYCLLCHMKLLLLGPQFCLNKVLQVAICCRYLLWQDYRQTNAFQKECSAR